MVLLDGRDTVIEGAKAFVVESQSHLVDHKLIDWLFYCNLYWDGVAELVSTFSIKVEFKLMSFKEEFWVKFRHNREWDLELKDRSWSNLEVDWDLDEVER